MSQPAPSPVLIFDLLTGYQKTAALRAAIELDLFTLLGEEPRSAAALAEQCRASEKGVRCLCDSLVVWGLLVRSEGNYALTPDSALFLDRRSPACMADAAEFLDSPTLRSAYERLTEAVRRGGTALEETGGTMATDHAVWVRFARGMAALMAMPAQAIPEIVGLPAEAPLRVLDLAAGHGLFGLGFARRHPRAQIVAQDWEAVLAVAQENAEGAGVADRYTLLPGSAFDVDYGSDYDVVLLTNFLHHFSPSTCDTLLRRVHAALKPGGVAVTLEFVPDEDRLTPPGPASFSLVMLATTAEGDAYTFAELDAMFRAAGFGESRAHQLAGGASTVIVTAR